MKENEKNYYINGATYFKKDFYMLRNKEQYKQEHYLNTGVSQYISKGEPIKIFTSCIASTEYLFKVIKTKSLNVKIYYFESNIDINELIAYYSESDVEFIRIAKNPKDEFKHNTIVFAGEDTVIFDSKMLGVEKGLGVEREVYRDKSKEDFKKYYLRAQKLI